MNSCAHVTTLSMFCRQPVCNLSATCLWAVCARTLLSNLPTTQMHSEHCGNRFFRIVWPFQFVFIATNLLRLRCQWWYLCYLSSSWQSVFQCESQSYQLLCMCSRYLWQERGRLSFPFWYSWQEIFLPGQVGTEDCFRYITNTLQTHLNSIQTCYIQGYR